MDTYLEIVFVWYIGKCIRKDSLKRKEIHTRIVFIQALNFWKKDRSKMYSLKLNKFKRKTQYNLQLTLTCQLSLALNKWKSTMA